MTGADEFYLTGAVALTHDAEKKSNDGFIGFMTEPISINDGQTKKFEKIKLTSGEVLKNGDQVLWDGVHPDNAFLVVTAVAWDKDTSSSWENTASTYLSAVTTSIAGALGTASGVASATATVASGIGLLTAAAWATAVAAAILGVVAVIVAFDKDDNLGYGKFIHQVGSNNNDRVKEQSIKFSGDSSWCSKWDYDVKLKIVEYSSD